MEKNLGAKGPVEEEAADKDKVEAEWVGHLPQDRVEIVSAQVAEQRLLMLSGSLVMQEAVLNVVQQ
ncbi:MAG: hypothetical protein GY845_19320 [Planctomycetes bacterium]|nr:hypothetical protein [Planctomycetota bacterium]